PRHSKRVFAFVVLALWNRPGAEVLLRPERAARMNQQHAHSAIDTLPDQNTGAAFGHGLSCPHNDIGKTGHGPAASAWRWPRCAWQYPYSDEDGSLCRQRQTSTSAFPRRGSAQLQAE